MPGSEGDRESLFGESMTLDEIEAQGGPGGEGNDDDADDDIPEAYKGKSPKEIIAIAELARTGMQTAEAARAAAESARQAFEANAGSRQSAAPTVEEPKELTREELQELYDKDPLEAIAKIEEQAMRRIEAHVQSRIEPLTAGTMSAAENWAREEFPDEFELFEGDIKKLINSVPNKSVFTSKQGWEDAVAYVRGQKNNFDKLVTHRAEKVNRENASQGRERERSNAGFNGRSSVRAGSRGDGGSDRDIANKMSDEQRQVAQRFIDDGVFKNFKEYNNWYNRGEA
jgi:hypothetical protein